MKLSIIIPAYNSEKFLGECLKSIFSQNYPNFEVIAVDAYSTDKTGKIFQEYLKHYPKKLHVVFRKPQGEYDAVNVGMEKATGDIVAYIDTDDTYEPKCFEQVVEAFERNADVLWLYGKGKVIDEKGYESRGIITAIKELFWSRYSYWSYQCFNYIVQPTVFMRKTFYNKIGKFNTLLKYDSDYEYWLRAGKITKPVFIDKYLASWRAHSGSISVKEYRPEAKEAFAIQRRFSKWWLRPTQWKVCWGTIFLYWVMGLINRNGR
jgi:glycosyltransferase involved in cell wall biosynthesis